MTSFLPEDLSAELKEWLATARARVSLNPERWPGVFVSLSEGEVAYLFERDDDGWITVFESSRGQEPVRAFRTPSLDVVERFLASEAGSAARFQAGVPGNVRVPFAIEELPAGATLQPVSDGPLGGLEQLLVDGVVIGEFAYAPRGVLAHADAVRAAHYGTAPIALIAQSYLDPDGSPLFTTQ
jgi:hypothetical protein